MEDPLTQVLNIKFLSGGSGVCVQVRGQLLGAASLRLLRGCQELNSGRQACNSWCLCLLCYLADVYTIGFLFAFCLFCFVWISHYNPVWHTSPRVSLSLKSWQFFCLRLLSLSIAASAPIIGRSHGRHSSCVFLSFLENPAQAIKGFANSVYVYWTNSWRTLWAKHNF